MYRLGTFFKRRYSKHSPNRLINPRNVYIRSSGITRCIESGQLIAAGLFPPTGPWLWTSDLGQVWQPIAVFSHTRFSDGV